MNELDEFQMALQTAVFAIAKYIDTEEFKALDADMQEVYISDRDFLLQLGLELQEQ